jgi:hypothetical protein
MNQDCWSDEWHGFTSALMTLVTRVVTRRNKFISIN